MAKTYAGISYLRLANYDKAINYFNQLQTDTSLRANPGKFYLAITLLKRNGPCGKEEAKRLLQEAAAQDLEEKKQPKNG